MYENRLTKRYYSFDHKNWHFVVLDGIGMDLEERNYYGIVDSVQMEWLKEDLQKNGKENPVVVSTHIPLLTISRQIKDGPAAGCDQRTVVTNTHEVRHLLEQYNVKLVLQGHVHFLEDIYYNGIHYITGGSVAGRMWVGSDYIEEGFLKIDISGDEFDWNYIDYGWEVK